MTNQEAFNIAVAGLAAQGFKRSMTARGDMCAYRGAGACDGMKCALGHLIPNELYSFKLEGRAVYEFGNHDDINHLLSVLGLEAKFVAALQRAHDNGHASVGGKAVDAPETMKAMLRRVADQYSLDKPSVLLADGAA